MTTKQRFQFNQMLAALKTIAKDYMTPEKLRKESEDGGQYEGLEYEESLEMAYENIQETAKNACKNVRPIKDHNELTQPDNL